MTESLPPPGPPADTLPPGPPADTLPPGPLAEARAAVSEALDQDGVALLPPMDVHQSLALGLALDLGLRCTMLDPWYNKGTGGVRQDYDAFVGRLLEQSAQGSDHVYLWGFPEIVARFVDRLPQGLELVAWLTWYYKNSPSVVRGWRSAQMACLHLSRPGARLHPEHFLNARQLDKQRQGKLRYLPGPTSVVEGQLDVIEEALMVGFVGRSEQTGHPAQKPKAVFAKLLGMVLAPGDVVLDPMCGSGTTGEAARDLGCRAVLADHGQDYTAIAAKRLGVRPIALPDCLLSDCVLPDPGSRGSRSAVGGTPEAASGWARLIDLEVP